MADQGSTQQQAPPSEAPPPQGGWQEAPQGGNPQQDNTKAMVAYILTWLTGLIIFLIADKNDKYTRYHAIQAIGFGIAVIIVFVALSILSAIFTATGTPGVGLTLSLVQLAAWVLVIIAIVMMCIKAYKGEKFKLPVIGDMAEKNA